LGTMVYDCLDCAYETPLPVCYSAPSSDAGACAAGAANGAACTTPCNESGTASGVCITTVDAGAGVVGKTDGCVCVVNAAAAMVWACATQWW
jgi:hypothetical protein